MTEGLVTPQAKQVADESSGFSTRQRKGEVVTVLNESKTEVSKSSNDEVVMSLIGDSVSNRVRFMSDRLEDKAAYIESRILAFAEIFERDMGTTCHAAVDAATPEPVWTVGR